MHHIRNYIRLCYLCYWSTGLMIPYACIATVSVNSSSRTSLMPFWMSRAERLMNILWIFKFMPLTLNGYFVWLISMRHRNDRMDFNLLLPNDIDNIVAGWTYLGNNVLFLEVMKNWWTFHNLSIILTAIWHYSDILITFLGASLCIFIIRINFLFHLFVMCIDSGMIKNIFILLAELRETCTGCTNFSSDLMYQYSWIQQSCRKLHRYFLYNMFHIRIHKLSEVV